MADLNKLMETVSARGMKLSKELKQFFGQYENLYKEIYREFSAQRFSAGSTEGLEDFYHLVGTVRRNRDVVGSLLRGANGLKSLDKYQILEEDDEPTKSDPELDIEALSNLPFTGQTQHSEQIPENMAPIEHEISNQAPEESING